MFKRMVGTAMTALILGAVMVGSVTAASPQVDTWTNTVDVPYFDCGPFDAHGVWTITHRLTLYADAEGIIVRDREVVDFRGAFVNPDTGAAVADSGRIIYFDTLAPDGSYLTTMQNFHRVSRFLHEAGRFDFQTETLHGMTTFDAGIDAVCAELGA